MEGGDARTFSATPPNHTQFDFVIETTVLELGLERAKWSR
jgi:hypothetical protein